MEKSDAIDADAGGRAHTPVEEGHPDLQKPERSDRDVGGPTPAEGAEGQPGTEGGVKGDIKTRGFEDDPHE
jgi:hypothetical protein